MLRKSTSCERSSVCHLIEMKDNSLCWLKKYISGFGNQDTLEWNQATFLEGIRQLEVRTMKVTNYYQYALRNDLERHAALRF